ncbi:MAG: hypothetical protein Q4E22_01110 [Coriobacteriia bacterium]|nr:hypothetical protein [Coriobacteriia bacterium]
MPKFGLTWVPQEARQHIVKSLAPDFLFVSADEFLTSNIKHRCEKRNIEIYVSVLAPVSILKQSKQELSKKAIEEELNNTLKIIEKVILDGADKVVIVEDLGGEDPLRLNPMFVVEELLPLYQILVNRIKSLGLDAIFKSSGDIHEFYPGLSNTGFYGVHIAHESEETTYDLFLKALEEGLIPFGGIISDKLSEEEDTDHACSFLDKLMKLERGDELYLCDDGLLLDESETLRAIEIIKKVK